MQRSAPVGAEFSAAVSRDRIGNRKQSLAAIAECVAAERVLTVGFRSTFAALIATPSRLPVLAVCECLLVLSIPGEQHTQIWFLVNTRITGSWESGGIAFPARQQDRRMLT